MTLPAYRIALAGGSAPAAPFAQRPRSYTVGAPQAAQPASLHTLAGTSMGTQWSVRLGNPHMRPLDGARQLVEQTLDAVVRQMSHWEPDSDLSRFGRAPAGSWQRLPEQCFAVLQAALDWARQSQGALDPTVGPLVALWGFGPHAQAGARRCPPDDAAIAALRPGQHWRQLALRPPTHEAWQPGGVTLDFSGIAKGFAVDWVLQTLVAAGWQDCLVEIGGELRASGQRPDGHPWRVAIAGEDGTAASGKLAPPLALRNMAMATTGDHWHAWEHAGQRLGHTIDPRSGRPVAHPLSSVTVLHRECMHADALATVLTVLGPDEVLAFAEAREVAALFAVRTPQGLLARPTAAFRALA